MKQYREYEVRYNPEMDAYETWVAVTEGHAPTEKDFGLEMSARCMWIEGAKDEPTCTEPQHIHFSILKAIARADALGYHITYRI